MPTVSGQGSSVERETHSIMSMQYLCIQVCMHSAALAQICRRPLPLACEVRALLKPVLAEQSCVYGFRSAWGAPRGLKGCHC